MRSLEIESCLVRIYCEANDRENGKYLHEAIVEAARAAGLAGATVLTGKMGFGTKGRIYSDLLVEMEIDREPTVVEVIDQPDRIQAFIPTLHDLVRGRRLITQERAEIIRYAAKDGRNRVVEPDDLT